MKKTLVTTLAALGLLMQGCGGSVCDDFEDAANTMLEKGEACFEAGEKEQIESSLEQVTGGCEEQLDKMEGEEKEQAEKAVSAFKSCVDDLDECSMESRDTWAAAFSDCLEGLGD